MSKAGWYVGYRVPGVNISRIRILIAGGWIQFVVPVVGAGEEQL